MSDALNTTPPTPDLNRVAMLGGVAEDRVLVWHKAGLFDRVKPTTSDWVARAHVLAQLEKAGVPLEALIAADREDKLARAWVFEFLQVASRGGLSFRDLVERTRLDEQFLLRLCDLLGIDDPSRFSDGEVAYLEALNQALKEGLPQSMAAELCEVWGSQMRFITHGETLSYDTNIARQMRADSESPIEAASRLAAMSRALLRFSDLIAQPLHRRHLLQAINLETDTDLARVQREALDLAPGELDVAICFVDLSGFTALTEKEGDRQAMTYSRLLQRAGRRIDRSTGASLNIVKRLGDGLMLASSTAAEMLEGALDMVALVSEEPNMPPARAGVAYGRAVSRAGDYFGRVVNIAARVLDHAGPSEVLATDEAVEEARNGPFTFSEPRDVVLRGIGEPIRLWRVEHAAAHARDRAGRFIGYEG